MQLFCRIGKWMSATDRDQFAEACIWRTRRDPAGGLLETVGQLHIGDGATEAC